MSALIPMGEAFFPWMPSAGTNCPEFGIGPGNAVGYVDPCIWLPSGTDPEKRAQHHKNCLWLSNELRKMLIERFDTDEAFRARMLDILDFAKTRKS